MSSSRVDVVAGGRVHTVHVEPAGPTQVRIRVDDGEPVLIDATVVGAANAATTWSNLGALYLLQNRPAEANEALTRAVAINPDLATAHNALGVTYARLGNPNRAVEEWRRALALRPDFADARANLERIGAR